MQRWIATIAGKSNLPIMPSSRLSQASSGKQEAILPVAALSSGRIPDNSRASKCEVVLFYLCVTALLILFGSIYFRDLLPPSHPLEPYVRLLHAGILSSLWASLPAPALLFACAPYFAQPERVTLVRYWIYLLYMVGVVVGALVFGSGVSVVECGMAACNM